MNTTDFTSLSWTNTDPVQITGTGEAFVTDKFTTSTDEDGNITQIPIYQEYTASLPLSDLPTDGTNPNSVLQTALVAQNTTTSQTTS